MLVGRERECGELARLLGEATDGRSSALLIRGEAGIGKSALLGYAVERAHELRMPVLAARGREAESEFAYVGLADLLRPVLGRLEAIPAPQAAALAGALALGPPVPAGRFTAGAATLSLLAAAAEEQPLLAAVDDVHWLDAPSRDALLFAARRLHAEGIVLLLAARPGEGAAFDPADIPQLALTGLGRGEATLLVATRAGQTVPESVAERLFLATAGNPLALLEMAASLSEGQLAGSEPLDEPLSVGPALERAFQQRLGSLPEATRRALLVAAASDSDTLETVVAAMRHVGLDVIALEPAEAVGILTLVGGHLHFRHPLVHSAVYHGASPAERRAAHRALAEALANNSSADRRAWHLAAAAVAPDEEVAAALEQAALDARSRSGYGAAAHALERAARLTPGPEERARRLLQAADTANVGGQPERALALLDEALASAADSLVRADIQHLRAQIQMWHEAPLPARELLLAEAARVEADAPDKAALMLADAALPYTMAGRLEEGLETARRAAAVAERAGAVAQTVATGVLGVALVLVGEARTGYPLALRCEALLRQGNPLVVYQLVRTFGPAAIWVEDYERARQALMGVEAAARAVSAPGPLPFALGALSELDFRTGRWADAYAVAGEAVRLAGDTGSVNELAYCLVYLARLEAAQGREADCRAHAARALELADALGTDSINTYATAALGLLELGLGRAEEAAGHLEQTARFVTQHGLREPGVVQWAPDLVEAYTRVGRRDDAEEALAGFQAQAEHTGRTWALAASARCHGLLAGDDDFEGHFEESLRWHACTNTPFERARTELCLGQRLRRARRRAPARPRLRSALEVFERLGAGPWAEQARAELRATGAPAYRLKPWTFRELTAQEVQVALAVAEGKTNREAAAALFLSPKTVEFHLGQIYEKLGLRSRTELVRLLARHGAIREKIPA